MRASVIGRRFQVAVLTATANFPEARVRAALERNGITVAPFSRR